MRSKTTKHYFCWTTEDGEHELEVVIYRTFYPGFYSGLPENCYPDEMEDSDPEYSVDGFSKRYSDLSDEMKEIVDYLEDKGYDPEEIDDHDIEHYETDETDDF